MTAILTTLIFLLADGSAAKHAVVRCFGMTFFEAGVDGPNTSPEGSRLVLDSRGATVLIVPEPRSIDCIASHDTQTFSGSIKLTNKAVERVWLK